MSTTSSNLDVILIPRTSDIGNMEVRRALPSAQRRMVGPYVFFDQMGPGILGVGQGLDVRPHPHIGLATVTYLFDGEIEHRDSLGSVQTIRPGAVNWMTAGSGIVHSERTPQALRPVDSSLFGIQIWVALPKQFEETAPNFVHHPAATLPEIDGEGKSLRVIAGSFAGARSPVECFSETLYVDARLDPGSLLEFPPEQEERAIYVVEGVIEMEGIRYESGQMLVLRPGKAVSIAAALDGPARMVLLGGEVMDGPRHVWWNFVSSSRERMEQAKADWQAGRFDQVPGESEFIPLPDTSPSPVRYP